jgi:hypothetical protein
MCAQVGYSHEPQAGRQFPCHGKPIGVVEPERIQQIQSLLRQCFANRSNTAEFRTLQDYFGNRSRVLGVDVDRAVAQTLECNLRTVQTLAPFDRIPVVLE